MSSVTYHHLEDIAKHQKEDDMWFIVDDKVYNVTTFADNHPGGVDVLLTVAGGDASNGFNSIGHSDSAKEELGKHYIGEVHPDDRSKLGVKVHGKPSNMTGIAIVGMLLALCAYCIITSLF